MKMEKEEVYRFYKALRDPNLTTMETLLKEYLNAKVPPAVILNEGLIGAMGILGKVFSEATFRPDVVFWRPTGDLLPAIGHMLDALDKTPDMVRKAAATV